jgi:hypothetical protein
MKQWSKTKKGPTNRTLLLDAGRADGTRPRIAGRGIACRRFPSTPNTCLPQGRHSYDYILAERTGLEPATPGVTGRYSNQLNYRSVFTDLFFTFRNLGGR